jgi:hypothetical protein
MHQVKKLIPAKCVRTHLNAPTVARMSRGRTHAQPALAVICVRMQGTCGRTHVQSALAATAVICDRTHALRSTTNNWCVRTHSNVPPAYK